MITKLKSEFEEIQYLIYGNIGEDSVGKNYEWDVFLKNKVENKLIDTAFYEQYQYEFHPAKISFKEFITPTIEEEENFEAIKSKFKNFDNTLNKSEQSKVLTPTAEMDKSKNVNAKTEDIGNFSLIEEEVKIDNQVLESDVVVKSKRKSKETPEKPKRKYNKKPKENK